MERTVVLTSRHQRTINLTVEGGVITEIKNESGVHFPFVIHQPYNRSVETWAERNNFLFNGEDLEQKHRKVYGIPIKHIPEGHPLRFIFPNKFR